MQNVALKLRCWHYRSACLDEHLGETVNLAQEKLLKSFWKAYKTLRIHHHSWVFSNFVSFWTPRAQKQGKTPCGSFALLKGNGATWCLTKAEGCKLELQAILVASKTCLNSECPSPQNPPEIYLYKKCTALFGIASALYTALYDMATILGISWNNQKWEWQSAPYRLSADWNSRQHNHQHNRPSKL